MVTIFSRKLKSNNYYPTSIIMWIKTANKPNINAPRGRKTKLEENVKADNSAVVCGSDLGKNKSFNKTAIWTYSIKSKYSKKVPIPNIPIASLFFLVRDVFFI